MLVTCRAGSRWLLAQLLQLGCKANYLTLQSLLIAQQLSVLLLELRAGERSQTGYHTCQDSRWASSHGGRVQLALEGRHTSAMWLIELLVDSPGEGCMTG